METSCKPFVTGLFCSILTIIQAYLSMGQYANELSSGCIKCSFNEILIKQVIFLILIPVALIHFFLKKLIKKDYVTIIVIIIYLIIVWLKVINTDIFETRVSSWSSFSSEDVDSFVFKQSFIPILICITVYIVFILILNKHTKKTLK
ncbi:hypothetical protein FNW52_17315 [Flavobacterium sp. ZT3R18]|uniref:hypothetical protein n=1 Tax=Flavobacterium sp. ZT3R18 TaxID=2594429 RepID=UPI0011798FBC|nr:hypothetical protein [Flavobacterium sp. ZT3R18]TRX32194.1 hypothetical protein FNW52_17315 [Flavobacterium sp. ZT3R18]